MSSARLSLAGLVLAAAACGALLLGTGRDGGSDPATAGRQAPDAAGLLGDLVEAFPDHGFERPSGPWALSLPADHGAHPSARTESWVLAAHLEDEAGRTLGLHFSLSRFGLRAPSEDAGGSPWDLAALHRAHVVLAREGSEGFEAEERFSRGALGTAGHDAAAAEVRLDDWSLSYARAPGGTGLALDASVGAVPLRLRLAPVKAAVDAGDDPGAPMRGFALPRLRVEGTVGAGEARRHVSGLAWLDRLWGEVPLPGGPVAYDRLLVQFDDGTDLSLVRTRRIDGRGVATVEGAAIGPDGATRRLGEEALSLEPAGDGSSPAWRVAGAGLDLAVEPVVGERDQGFLLPAWNGLVRVEGRRDGAPVAGLGTLQLAGGPGP